MRVLSVLLLSSILISITGCATRQTQRLSCRQRDWYEIGRRDGAQGAPVDRVGQYRHDCGGAGGLNEHDETVYLNGRNAGLVEYCQPESAFQLGRAGQPYHSVCPAPVEDAFLANYRRGQRARELEQRSRDLDAEIDSLSNLLLRAGNVPARDRLSIKINRLRQARARAERDLSQIAR